MCAFIEDQNFADQSKEEYKYNCLAQQASETKHKSEKLWWVWLISVIFLSVTLAYWLIRMLCSWKNYCFTFAFAYSSSQSQEKVKFDHDESINKCLRFSILLNMFHLKLYWLCDRWAVFGQSLSRNGPDLNQYSFKWNILHGFEIQALIVDSIFQLRRYYAFIRSRSARDIRGLRGIKDLLTYIMHLMR